ncbi:hypothetical protein [Nocardiopsis sp. MG754419]|uniref:hypothetical protein n=1 Tax=Nocardiopsis sp. MG754419 TaxID=2259865 RepID=UPI001BA65015|nr:hypothetical protein [Nocardiopsis sp. MG754419]MBR8741422.1 hypothetical protein [Nocardiopsis sp. MG754419]
MALEINAAYVQARFGPLAVTPDQVRQVRQCGPGAVITADLVSGRYRAHAPGELDPRQNARLVVFTHQDLQHLVNKQHNLDWERLAQDTTVALRQDMHDWPSGWFASATVVALRAALATEGFWPHTRTYVTDWEEARAIQILVFTPDPRVLMSISLPALRPGPVMCEARLMSDRYAELAHAQGPVCTDTAPDIAQGLAGEARTVLNHM